MIPEYKLKAKDVRHKMLETMHQHISLEAHGYQCTTEMVMDVVLKASAEQSSIEAARADLEEVADSNTVREYLNQSLMADRLRERRRR